MCGRLRRFVDQGGSQSEPWTAERCSSRAQHGINVSPCQSGKSLQVRLSAIASL